MPNAAYTSMGKEPGLKKKNFGEAVNRGSKVNTCVRSVSGHQGGEGLPLHKVMSLYLLYYVYVPTKS